MRFLSWECHNYSKISDDVPNNSEVLKKMTMLHRDVQKSEISGNISTFTHGLFVSRIGLSLIYIFGKCVSNEAVIDHIFQPGERN